jgi:hypothetical protein
VDVYILPAGIWAAGWRFFVSMGKSIRNDTPAPGFCQKGMRLSNLPRLRDS